MGECRAGWAGVRRGLGGTISYGFLGKKSHIKFPDLKLYQRYFTRTQKFSQVVSEYFAAIRYKKDETKCDQIV